MREGSNIAAVRSFEDAFVTLARERVHLARKVKHRS